MTTDNADLGLVIVRRFMSATGADSRLERARLLREDFVLSSAGGLPYSGVYHGLQGFFDLVETMSAVLDLRPATITLNPLGTDAVAVHKD
jgi:hypothetical protein